MSHLTKRTMAIKAEDLHILKKALLRTGIKEQHIKVSEKGMKMVGYYSTESRNANVIVSKQAEKTYAPIGFEKNSQGTIDLHIDEMDINKLSEWKKDLIQYYGLEKAYELAENHGFMINEEEANAEGDITLTLATS